MLDKQNQRASTLPTTPWRIPSVCHFGLPSVLPATEPSRSPLESHPRGHRSPQYLLTPKNKLVCCIHWTISWHFGL